MCDQCHERPYNHRIWLPVGPDEPLKLCCKCYVEQGNPPADWHPLCILTYADQQRKRQVA